MGDPGRSNTQKQKPQVSKLVGGVWLYHGYLEDAGQDWILGAPRRLLVVECNELLIKVTCARVTRASEQSINEAQKPAEAATATIGLAKRLLPVHAAVVKVNPHSRVHKAIAHDLCPASRQVLVNRTMGQRGGYMQGLAYGNTSTSTQQDSSMAVDERVVVHLIGRQLVICWNSTYLHVSDPDPATRHSPMLLRDPPK